MIAKQADRRQVPPPIPLLRRILYAIAVLVLIVVLAEVVMRVAFGFQLPSHRHTWELGIDPDMGLGHEIDDENHGSIVCRIDNTAFRSPEPPPGLFRLAVVGDSVVAGIGAEESNGVADVLGRELGALLGLPVRVTNLGSIGADFCVVAQKVSAALSVKPYDALVHVLFADDLMPYLRIVVGKITLLLPSRIENPLLRSLMSHSYCANALWVHLPYIHRPFERIVPVPEDIRESFKAAMVQISASAEKAGVPHLVVLLSFPEHAWRRDNPDAQISPWSRISDSHLEAMAALLDEAGVPFLDLRSVWDDEPVHVCAAELPELAIGGAGVHPDDAGHALLARRILPALHAKVQAHAKARGR